MSPFNPFNPFSRRTPPARGAADGRSEFTCRELVDLVTDYWEGALGTADHVRFEAHVDACGHCAAYLEQLRLTVTVTGELEPEALDPEVERELLAAFHTWKVSG